MITPQPVHPVPFHGPALYQQPYPLFQQLRQQGEIHYVQFPSGVCGWLVTGYDASIKTLTHPRIGKNHKLGNPAWRRLASIMPEPQHTVLQSHLLHQDPPRHTMLRNLILDAFAPTRVAALRPTITRIAHSLADVLCTQNQCDLIADFAARLPLLVLSHVIGLADVHRDQFNPTWCKVVQPVGPQDPARPAYTRRLCALQNYIDTIIHESRGGDQDRLIVRLIRAHDLNTITRNELCSLLFQLLVAGQEPVTNQIGNAMLALLDHPEQLEHLKRHPEQIGGAITELVRFDGAFSISTWRFFAETTEWLGATVQAGDAVIVALNAANHDPTQFSCPHQLNISRPAGKPLSFGYDHHYCPATALARLELEISISVLLERFPELNLACDRGALRWVCSVLARGLTALPVHTMGSGGAA